MKTSYSCLTAASLALSSTAAAQGPELRLPPQPLAQSLEQLAIKSRSQIAFSTDQVRHLQAPALSGRKPTSIALATLLRGTSLTYRATPHGFVIVPRAPLMRTSAALLAQAGGSEQPTTAAAPSTEPEPVQIAGDIVVTAQRREERLQDVPIAITALGNETLAQRGVTDLSGLRGSVPGLTISNYAGFNASNVVSLRGISGQPLPIGASQATALYLDGVYLARPDGAFFSLDDVERVEVLRGPQGTLYGRNATAGAVNVITREPGRNVQGGVNLSYGNYDTVSGRGSLSGPITDTLAAGVSIAYDARDGYFINTVTGNRVGEQNSLTGRLKLRYEDGPFDATLAGDFTRFRGGDFMKNIIVGGAVVGIGDPKRLATEAESVIFSDRDAWGISFTMNREVSDDLTLTSISSYRSLQAATIYDSGGSATPDFLSFGDNSSKSFNQELRLVFGGPGPLRVTAGANYFYEDADFKLQISPTLPPGAATPRDTSKLHAVAGFTQAEFDLTDALTLIGGLRLNYETRRFTVDYTNGFPVRGKAASGRVSDTALLPSLGLNYKPDQDVLLYAKYSKGYQAPGFNYNPGVNTPPSEYDFAAETLDAYEVGAKTQFLDRRVTFNVAAFWYDSKNLQIRTNALPVGTSVVSNSATATTKGFEVEAIVRPIEGLTLSGQATYSKATYDSFCELYSVVVPLAGDPECSPGFAQRAGKTLFQAPRWSGGASAAYVGDLSDRLRLNASLNYSFESKVFFSAANIPEVGNEGWHRLDARLGLEIDDGPEVYVYGRNLTDNRYIGYIFRVNANISTAVLNEPRTYGVGLRYRF